MTSLPDASDPDIIWMIGLTDQTERLVKERFDFEDGAIDAFIEGLFRGLSVGMSDPVMAAMLRGKILAGMAKLRRVSQAQVEQEVANALTQLELNMERPEQ